MIFTRSDLPYIRWSLFGFLLALGAGGTAVWYGGNFVERANSGQQAAQHRLNETRKQLAAVNTDRENMQNYALEYGALLEGNIVGDEQRLEWIEGMERIRRQSRLPDFSYAIMPQQPYAPAILPDNGNFKLAMSSMSMQFRLLHEGQLIAFLDALHNEVKGRFVLERCAMERYDTQLKAECAGGWLTLKKRGAK
jgi:hypothetical protein